ncbi:MAG TPA: TonB-dependent receptor [Caulobacteraceae bacterium]
MKYAAGCTAAAALMVGAGGAVAQTAPAPAPAASAATEGVTAYPAAFFADSQPNSAMDMLNRVPGFSFNGGDSVRGFGGAAGNVLVDGQRPTSKSDPLEDIIRRIPAGQVDRIELIRGGAPGIDMQGQSVVVNIVRRTDARGQTVFAVASGLYQDGRTTPAMRFEGSRRLSGDRQFEWSSLLYSFLDDGAGEGPRTRTNASGAIIRNSYYDETADGRGLTLSGGWRQPLAGGRLALNARAQTETFDFALEDSVFAPAPDLLTVEDEFSFTSTELGANWERPLSGRTRMELIGLQRLREEDLVSAFAEGGDDGVFESANTSGESIGRVVLRHTRSDTLSFEGGGEVAFNFLESAIAYTENGVPQVVPSANVRVEELRSEGFATGTWRPSPRLSVEAGLRLETSTITQSGDIELERSFFYPKPRLLLTWTPAAGHQLRLRAEREVGQLDFGDFVSAATFSTGTVTAGAENLEPHKVWALQATYERRFWGDAAFTVEVSHNIIQDAIDRVLVVTPGGSFEAPGNIGDGTSDQLVLTANIPLTRLGVTGGLVRGRLSWVESRVTDPTTGEERPSSGNSPFVGELHFSQDLPQHRLQWGADMFLGNVSTAYAYNRISSQEVETWYTLYAEYKPQPGLSLRLEAQNLGGRNLIREQDVFSGPRNTSGLLYRDRRDQNFDPFIYFRLRKTWG